MTDDFNCEFADVCDLVCLTSDCATSGSVNDTVCPIYMEVKE